MAALRVMVELGGGVLFNENLIHAMPDMHENECLTTHVKTFYGPLRRKFHVTGNYINTLGSNHNQNQAGVRWRDKEWAEQIPGESGADERFHYGK